VVYRNLKPGGWIEIQDIFPYLSSDDGTATPDHPVNKFYSAIGSALRDKYGFDLRAAEHHPALLESLGYVNVQKKVFHIPLGEWARDTHLRFLGGYLREVLLDFVGAMAARPLVEAGLDKDEIDELIRDVAVAVGNKRIHAYMPMHFVWAQRPPA
jgi:hypothetical protein